MSGYARGFTLLEIMLVLALVAGATLMLSAALARGGERQRFYTDAAQLANGLRDTRARALQTQAMQRFELDPDRHLWRSAGGAPRELSKGTDITLNTAEELRLPSGGGAILFYPDGASSGGRIELSRNGAVFRLDIHWLTGQVRSQRLQGG